MSIYRTRGMRGFGDVESDAAAAEGQPGAQAAPLTISNVLSSLVKQGIQAAPTLVQAAIDKKLGKGKVTVPTSLTGKPAAKAGLPGWVLPVAIGGVVVVGGLFFFKSRKGVSANPWRDDPVGHSRAAQKGWKRRR